MVLEAHGAFAQIAPDALLVDLIMPSEDGYWFIDRLKGKPREGGRPAPAAIAVSGHSEGHRERAMRAGFDAFVPKPVDVDLLCETIERLAHRNP